MSTTSHYRQVAREIYKASLSPRATRNPIISQNFRAIFEKAKNGEQSAQFERDISNAVTFMRAQRVHRELLERYNPLFDLTAEERIEATARRVGLNMPETAKDA